MPDYTSHYNLIKPKKGENYDVEDTTCTNADIIDTELFKRQEKIPGKGLSTNDFTNQYKQKLDSLQNYDDSQVKQDISNMKREQTTQNTNISANTTKNAEQDSLIQKLKDNMINLQTEEATSLYVTDAGTPPASLKVRGNHRQDGTPTLENPIEIETVKNEVNVVVSNKNRFNVPSKNQNGIDLVLQEDGSYLINGASTVSWPFLVGSTIPLEPGDYTLSIECNKALNQGYFGIQNWGDFKQELGATGEKHINLTETKKVQCYFTCNLGSTFDNVVVKVQLEKSNVKTDSIKHEEIKKTLDIQQEMLKGDDFDLENEKENHGYEKKNMSEIDWVVSSNQLQEKTYCFMVMYSVAGLSSTEINCFSNCFKSLTGSYLFANDEEGIAQSQSQILCRISKEKVEDLNAFKALLAEKNAVVYVKNPTQLDLTETQKQQLTQLDNLDLFKGINNIYTEEGIALIQLDYSADTKQTVDSLNDRITALEQQLNSTGSEG